MASSHQTLNNPKAMKKYDFFVGSIKIQTNRNINTPDRKYNLALALLGIKNEIMILTIVDTHEIEHRKDEILNELKKELMFLKCAARLLEQLIQIFPEEASTDLLEFCIYQSITEKKKSIKDRERVLDKSKVKLPEIKTEKDVEEEEAKQSSPLLNSHLHSKRKPLTVNLPILKQTLRVN